MAVIVFKAGVGFKATTIRAGDEPPLILEEALRYSNGRFGIDEDINPQLVAYLRQYDGVEEEYSIPADRVPIRALSSHAILRNRLDQADQTIKALHHELSTTIPMIRRRVEQSEQTLSYLREELRKLRGV